MNPRTEPPMPRSAKTAQKAAAAEAVVAAPASHRIRRNTSGIDKGKYKTKPCRNYMMGVACPYESRCAFSHGEQETKKATSSVAASEEGSVMFEPQSTTSAHAQEFPVVQPYVDTAATPSSEEDLAIYHQAAAASAPPSYEAFIMSQLVEPASPIVSDAGTPLRPRRHNPYNPCVFGYPYGMSVY